MMGIKPSIALVTRNRPTELDRCLASWRRQSVAPLEIVVSDDSDPALVPVVLQTCEKYGARWITGPRRGLYANRNNAALACRGSHILSADDDHTHPPDFLETIIRVAGQDPGRVWIFGERHPEDPNAPLICPAELAPSGFGQAPANPDDCAAIADGGSLYPREIFDSGLRYDETYRFGGLWYLLGKLLVMNGWRISFSKETFYWHHYEKHPLESIEMARDKMRAATYCMFVNAFCLDRRPRIIVRAMAAAGKRWIGGYDRRHHWVRLRAAEIVRCFRETRRARDIYRSPRPGSAMRQAQF